MLLIASVYARIRDPISSVESPGSTFQTGLPICTINTQYFTRNEYVERQYLKCAAQQCGHLHKMHQVITVPGLLNASGLIIAILSERQTEMLF